MSTVQPAQGQAQQKPTAMTHAVQSRTIGEIITDLSKPIPDRHLKKKPVGNQGATVPYIPWHMVVKYLDLYAPGWSFDVTRVYQLSGRVCVAGRLTIFASDGTFYRDATGTEVMEVSGYGDPTSNAEGMCIRRCAAKFGLGLYLYAEKPPEQGHGGGGGQQRQGQGQQPAMISAKQLNYARSLCSEKGRDLDLEASGLFPGRGAEDLTMAEAKQLIDHLIALPNF